LSERILITLYVPVTPFLCSVVDGSLNGFPGAVFQWADTVTVVALPRYKIRRNP
jgi:hypothetical protein